jgi:hypothetical protein
MSQPNVSRRTFIKASTIATFAAPNLILADKSGNKTVTVGTGEYTYECIHDWAKLPDGHTFGGASHGLTFDKQGSIYISHRGTPGSIFVFDPEGKFVRSMVNQFTKLGHGIDLREEDGEEFLYLAPADGTGKNGFAKVSLKGDLVWHKNKSTIDEDSGLYKSGKGRFRATNISFAPDGGYFLGDGYGSGYIHRYDKNDKYVSSFGGEGKTDGKFKTPHGQWLDDRDGIPKTVVCDRANKRLQWFDMDGNFLKKMDGFLFPADIDIQGDIMLIPDLHARITMLDKNNNVITQLGDDPHWRAQVLADNFKMRGQRDRWQPGKFVHPHDACFDKDGNIFVAEWVNTGRVTKLRRV